MNLNLSRNGFTLVEMTVVILVLLTLISSGLFVSKQYGNWQAGRTASEDLRTVYAAQRMYLADNPTAIVSELTPSQLIPYLANRANSLPTVKSLEGTILTIGVDASPPYIDDGSGGVYDPTADGPSSKPDSLWDVGE